MNLLPLLLADGVGRRHPYLACCEPCYQKNTNQGVPLRRCSHPIIVRITHTHAMHGSMAVAPAVK